MDPLLEKMKMEAVTDSIAAFQAALEKSLMTAGCRELGTLHGLVSEYALRLMVANSMFPEMENDVPKKDPQA